MNVYLKNLYQLQHAPYLHSYSSLLRLSNTPRYMACLLGLFACAVDGVGECLLIVGTLPLALFCLRCDPPCLILSPRKVRQTTPAVR